MSKHVYINPLETAASEPETVVVSTSGIPEVIAHPNTDVGIALRGLLTLFGAEVHDESSNWGNQLYISLSRDAITAALDGDEYADRVGQITRQAKGSTGADVLRFTMGGQIDRMLLWRIPRALRELPPDAPLTRVVGAIVLPFADAAHTDDITLHFDQIVYWQ